jgi:DNA-binding HxlR family transcriptional regulator
VKLAKQLGELRDDGLVSRELLEEAPRKTVYELTEQGRSLEPVLDAILKWGLNAQQPL